MPLSLYGWRPSWIWLKKRVKRVQATEVLGCSRSSQSASSHRRAYIQGPKDTPWDSGNTSKTSGDVSSPRLPESAMADTEDVKSYMINWQHGESFPLFTFSTWGQPQGFFNDSSCSWVKKSEDDNYYQITFRIIAVLSSPTTQLEPFAHHSGENIIMVSGHCRSH